MKGGETLPLLQEKKNNNNEILYQIVQNEKKNLF